MKMSPPYHQVVKTYIVIAINDKADNNTNSNIYWYNFLNL